MRGPPHEALCRPGVLAPQASEGLMCRRDFCTKDLNQRSTPTMRQLRERWTPTLKVVVAVVGVIQCVKGTIRPDSRRASW